MDSFIQIGDACGGFIDIAHETKDMTEIIEASIRIKDNCTGFIPTFIELFENSRKSHIVQTIV